MIYRKTKPFFSGSSGSIQNSFLPVIQARPSTSGMIALWLPKVVVPITLPLKRVLRMLSISIGGPFTSISPFALVQASSSSKTRWWGVTFPHCSRPKLLLPWAKQPDPSAPVQLVIHSLTLLLTNSIVIIRVRGSPIGVWSRADRRTDEARSRKRS